MAKQQNQPRRSRPQPPQEAQPDEPAGAQAPLDDLGISPQSAAHPAAVPLLEAWARFKAGQYGLARGALSAVSQAQPPDDVAEAARRLKAAMDIDPATLIFASASAAFFITVLVLVY